MRREFILKYLTIQSTDFQVFSTESMKKGTMVEIISSFRALGPLAMRALTGGPDEGYLYESAALFLLLV